MRIAHFSDLHLLSLEGAKILDFANKRWIGGLNLLTNRGRHYHSEIFEAMVEDICAAGVDHVICTGDLTNLAFEQEFRFALERFQRIALEPHDVTVVPGNHDTYVAKGSDYFREIFDAYHRSDPEWQHQHTWPVVRVRGRVAIIGVSSSRPTPWFTAYGRIGDDQLERLAAVLADPRLEGMLRIVALHHPPVGPAAKNRIRGLKDHRALHSVIAEHGAELIIHGHEHRDMRLTMPGPADRLVDVLGVQSGTYHANRPHRTARYRIFEISSELSGELSGELAGELSGDVADTSEPDGRGKQRVRHYLRRWDAEARTFGDDPDDVPLSAGLDSVDGTMIAS